MRGPYVPLPYFAGYGSFSISCLLKSNIVKSNFQYHPKCVQLQVSHVCFADDLFPLSPTCIYGRAAGVDGVVSV